MPRFRPRPALGIGLAVLLATPAWAGSAFRTDDPEMVEPGKWEITLFSSGTSQKPATTGFGPAVESNYGAAPGLTLHLITAFGTQHSADKGLGFGTADTELGAKLRLLAPGDDDWFPQLALFPLVEIPTGNQGLGQGTGHAQVFLPVWMQKEFGAWTVSGGGGYWINPGAGQRNGWLAGAAVWRKITGQLSLGAELFHQSRLASDQKATTGFNIGATYALSERWQLQASAGRGLRNADTINRFSYYAGLQVTF